ncbi:MAG: hypothetical protein ACUVXB_11610, partial [Bryobacteraceae bacterium]
MRQDQLRPARLLPTTTRLLDAAELADTRGQWMVDAEADPVAEEPAAGMARAGEKDGAPGFSSDLGVPGEIELALLVKALETHVESPALLVYVQVPNLAGNRSPVNIPQGELDPFHSLGRSHPDVTQRS